MGADLQRAQHGEQQRAWDSCPEDPPQGQDAGWQERRDVPFLRNSGDFFLIITVASQSFYP